jgi:type I restriction enzyme S subunit
MIADLKPYSEYKDSGLPWLSQMPEHWGTRRLRHVCEMRVSNVDKHTKKGETAVRLCNYVDVYKNERIRESMSFMLASASEDERIRFCLRKGDVVITKDSEDWNDIGVPSLVEFEAPDLVCGYHLAILRPRTNLQGQYLHRALQSHFIAAQFHVEANGVTRYGLAHGAIKGISIPLPPPDEQAAIVRFLGHANRRLEKTIRAKRKVIALLNEQKQAIIHRAVTRGLDPSVTLKPSGIPWLGDIPQHWGVVRNLALFSHRVEHGVPGLPILQVSLRSGVTIEDRNQFGRAKRFISDHTKYKLMRVDDLAYNTMRMWQGAIGVSPVDGLVSPAYVVVAPRPGVISRYYEYVFRTTAYKEQVNRFSTGIVSDRNRLYWESFKQMPNIQLPREEQQAICVFIQEQTCSLDAAAARLRREIDLLREYRIRLVADVVTGKLDVREAARNLPDEAELPDTPEANAVDPDAVESEDEPAETEA